MQNTLWHPFTQMQTAAPPIHIVKGEGSYLYAQCGTRYIDAISSWWVNLHGHTHPHIVQAIEKQLHTLEHVLFAGFTHTPAQELASRLIKILPGNMSKVFYSDNGSTAVETALKIALQYFHNKGTPKSKILCFKNSYHGDTFGAMSAAGKNKYNRPFWSHLFDVDTLETYEIPATPRDVAGCIFEPLIMGAGGMITYPKEQLEALIKWCRSHDIITIADEVMTGFGRTGTLFACDQLNETPDIICLSKGITGGFLPLGATCVTQKIYDAFLSDSQDAAFLHGHSYTANPLACSSGCASLDLLESEACTQQRATITQLHEAFCQTWKNHPKFLRCEVLGTILIVEYRGENIRDKLVKLFLENSIIVRPLGNVLYIMPPYCISQEDLNKIYDTIILGTL